MDQVTLDLASQGQWHAVEMRCRQLLAGIDPPATALLFLAVAACQQGKADEGCRFFRRFLTIEPSASDAWRNLGMVQFNRDALDIAARDFYRAIALSPEDKDSWTYLGHSLYLMSRFKDALRSLKKAVALFPDDQSLRLLLFYPFHRLGQLDKAWQMLNADPSAITSHNIPTWRGGDLEGKTILVWCGANGSLGDDMIFASLIPDLIAKGARVMYECEPRLLPLLGRSFPDALFVPYVGPSASSVSPPFPPDCQVYSRRLVAYCRPTLESFAGTYAYLKADPQEVTYWRARLKALGAEPKVGISWRSGAAWNRIASLEIRDFVQILQVPGVTFINIQYTDCRAELAAIRDEIGVEIINFEEIDITREVDRSAALMSSLDLAICVENTSGIIAAATGVPSWFIKREAVHNDATLPWFPRARRFFRKWDETWATPVDAAAAALEQWIGERRAR